MTRQAMTQAILERSEELRQLDRTAIITLASLDSSDALGRLTLSGLDSEELAHTLTMLDRIQVSVKSKRIWQHSGWYSE